MTTVFNLNRYDKIVANDLSLNGTISTALGGLSQWEDSGSDIYFSSGNVGIGTTSPGSKLDVNGSIRGGYDSNTTSYFGRTAIGATSTYGDQAYFSHIDKTSAGEYALIQNSSGSTLINAADGQNIWFRVNNNTKMILNSGGNVGIGTTTPMSKLEVNGAASFTGPNASFNSTDTVGIHLGNYGTDFPMMQLVSNSADGAWIDFAFTDSIVSSSTYDDRHGRLRYGYTNGFTFETARTERMRIDSNGRVGIGRDDNINTGCRLHVAPGSGGGGIYIVYIENGKYVFNNTTSSASNTSIVAEDDVVVGGAIGLFSDRRIKQNILEIDDASSLEKLRLLKPSYYNYKDKVMRTNEVVEGFIAQEVREVLPYAVKETTTTIPNIFLLGTYQVDASSNSIITIPDFDTFNLERDASGNIFTRLKLYIEKNNENKDLYVDIEEVISSTQLKVCVDESQSIPTSGNIFIYGQEVNNFCHLQKDRIFTIATSALQEVDRQQQADKANIASLESENATLKTQVADILQRLSNAGM